MEISVFDIQPADTSPKAVPNAQGTDARDAEGSSFEDMVEAQNPETGVAHGEDVSSTEVTAPRTEDETDGAEDHVTEGHDPCCQEYASYQDQLPAISLNDAVDTESSAVGQPGPTGQGSGAGESPQPVIVPTYPLTEAPADVVESAPATGNGGVGSGAADAADAPAVGPDNLLEMSDANDGVEAGTSSAKIPASDTDALLEMSSDNDGFEVATRAPEQIEETQVPGDLVSKVGSSLDKGLSKTVPESTQPASGTEKTANESTVEASASMEGAGSDVNADASGDGLEYDGPVTRLLNMTSPGSHAQSEGAAVTFENVASQAVQTPRATGNTVDPAAIYEKLDDGLRLSVAGGGKEVRITFHPDNLGHLRIKLQVEQNAVNARITVDSVEVKGILEADSSRLKELFGAQGLVLDKYSIEFGLNGSGLNDNEWGANDWTGAPAGDGRRADKANENEGDGSVSAAKPYAHPGTFGTRAASGIDVFV